MANRTFINVKLEGTNRSVNKLYQAYNKYYFDGQLENVPVRFGKNKKSRAVGEYNSASMEDYIDDRKLLSPESEIVLNPILKKSNRLMCIVLLHEMNHVANGSEHGKVFQRGIRRLFKIGAYENLL